MTAPELPLPPPGSPYRVTANGEAILISCPGKGIQWPVLVLLCCLAALLPGMTLYVMIADGDPAYLMNQLLFFFIPLIPIGGILGHYVRDRSQHATITVAGGRLQVDHTGLFWPRRHHCDRSEFYGMTPISAAYALSDKFGGSFLTGRPTAEVRWFADLLAQVLQIESTCPPGPGETEVAYSSDPAHPPVRGYLGVQRGRMWVRYFALDRPDYEFFDMQQASGWKWVQVVVSFFRHRDRHLLAAEDIRCQWSEDGKAFLQITRSLPRLTLTVWCDDTPALQCALARFWGNEEGSGEPGA